MASPHTEHARTHTHRCTHYMRTLEEQGSIFLHLPLLLLRPALSMLYFSPLSSPATAGPLLFLFHPFPETKGAMCSLSTPSPAHSSLSPQLRLFFGLCGPPCHCETSFNVLRLSLSSLSFPPRVPPVCHCSCLFPPAGFCICVLQACTSPH